MNHIRWYDKNSELKEVFEFIQGLDEDHQTMIAHEILQILMNDFGLNLDGQINRISCDCNYACNRWYDNNIDLYTSFEIIRVLDFEHQKLVAKKIAQAIMFMYLEGASSLNG